MCSFRPLLAGLLITSSIIISISPTLQSSASDFASSASIGW
jgi:hypothetical protein